MMNRLLPQMHCEVCMLIAYVKWKLRAIICYLIECLQLRQICKMHACVLFDLRSSEALTVIC